MALKKNTPAQPEPTTGAAATEPVTDAATTEEVVQAPAPADLDPAVAEVLETTAAQAAAPLDPALVAQQADDAAKAVAEAKGLDPAQVATHAKVRNVRKVAQRQPSTGIWVGANEEAWLLKDGWLDNQVKAKLLEIVE